MQSSSHSAGQVHLQAQPALQDRCHQEPQPVQCVEAREETEDVELILVTGPCILGSHQPTCERNVEQTYGLSLLRMQDQWEALPRDYAICSI